ncbi:TPA: hypothetical protein N0F65_005660 [Lagenidium giganteum]|uniref:WD repeat-containing protein 75 second beta-propeller domain-containing protein n=1 Tax=Lagenidium giganteum TaxID=4803 RepID=A0AAV2ZHV3_9STRA|nr:TPA: hypothetical protein N0F65_005660 [Lagenidium giganteum]
MTTMATTMAPTMQAIAQAPELLTTRRSPRVRTNVAPLKYSLNGKYLFQREAHIVRVLHAKNGQLLHECVRADVEAAAAGASCVRHEVTAIAPHPLNSLQVLAAYEDGKVIVWDFIEEKILQEFDAKAPILWMAVSVNAPTMLMMVVSTADKDSDVASKWALIEFNMKRKRRGRTILDYAKLPFHTADMQSVEEEESQQEGAQADGASWAFQGDFIVISAGARLLAVRVQKNADNEGNGRPFVTQKLYHMREVTCVAVHPRKLEFSIGDSLGQIFRFHGNALTTTTTNASALALSTAKMHWHSHAVTCLTYSIDGNYLLSGGEECVLVSWHLESGRRAYLPRRSAALEFIAPRLDGAGYAVALQDHVVFQYNHVTKEEEWHSLGLARSGFDAHVTLPSRQMAFDPVSQAIPLNGVSSAGILQFYNPYKDRVLQSVMLTERNQVTRTEDEEIPQIVAESVRFSPSGHDLVTLHSNVLTDAKKGDDQSLRFWKRRENGSFFVNTAVDAPHGTATVSCMAFSPSSYNDCVVTADVDGEFKMWKKSADASSWHCQSVVKFRDEPISAVAFTADGSLLAVAYNHLLTLWDVGTNALRHVITSSDGSAIQQVVFTGKTSPYVVLKTGKEVQVWNLLNFDLWWRYEVPASCHVSAEAHNDEFLVWMQVEEDKEELKYLVLTFNAAQSMPVRFTTFVLDTEVWSVQFHPKNGDLLVMDVQLNVWRIGEQQSDKNRRKDALAKAAADAEEAGVLDSLYKRASRSAAAMKKKQFQQTTANHKNANALFEAPAHVLPSMTALYRSFMDTMLPKPSRDVSNGAEEDDASKEKKSKKKNKKRKKQSAPSTDDAPDAADTTADATRETEKQKRAKTLVEKEMANSALQQQTYSKLLEAFRQRRSAKQSS